MVEAHSQHDPIVFLNGQHVSQLPLSCIEYLGHGVFETILLKRLDQKRYGALGFETHLKRMREGIRFFNLSFIPEVIELSTLISQACTLSCKNFPDQLVLRLVSRESHWLMMLEPFIRNYPYGGISVCALKGFTRQFPKHKHSSALTSLTARRVARERGFQEALLVSSDDTVTEGEWSSLLWSDEDERLFTSMHNVLPGVTMELIGRSHTITPRKITIDELKTEANELIFLRSTDGIVAVNKLDTSPLPGVKGKTFCALNAWYQKLYNQESRAEGQLFVFPVQRQHTLEQDNR